MAGNNVPTTAIRNQPPAIAKPPSDPRDIHPAVTETVAKLSQVWDDNDRLTKDNNAVRNENEVLKRLNAEHLHTIDTLRSELETTRTTADERLARSETHYRDRLAESERAKEHYLRYAVALAERLNAVSDSITAAHNLALRMAGSEANLEKEIGSIVKDINHNH